MGDLRSSGRPHTLRLLLGAGVGCRSRLPGAVAVAMISSALHGASVSPSVHWGQHTNTKCVPDDGTRSWDGPSSRRARAHPPPPPARMPWLVPQVLAQCPPVPPLWEPGCRDPELRQKWPLPARAGAVRGAGPRRGGAGQGPPPLLPAGAGSLLPAGALPQAAQPGFPVLTGSACPFPSPQRKALLLPAPAPALPALMGSPPSWTVSFPGGHRQFYPLLPSPCCSPRGRLFPGSG